MSDVTAMHSEETMKYLDKQLIVKVHRDARVGLTKENDGSIVHRGGNLFVCPSALGRRVPRRTYLFFIPCHHRTRSFHTQCR